MPRLRSAEPRYRRRVVLELTPEESVLLDRLADRHGTIRGAVLAGLHEVDADRSAALEEQVRVLTEELAAATGSAGADRDRATAEVAALHEELAASRQALREARAQAKQLRADLRVAKTRQANETAARRAAEQARRSAEALLVHHAYCASCEKLVPESQWAEHPWRGGFATYHKAHPFRDKTGTFLGQPASVLFWRAHRGAGDGS